MNFSDVLNPNRNPAERIRFGSEKQQNARGMRFLCGAEKTRRKRYNACDGLEKVNTFEALTFRLAAKNQIEAQRSGFDLERRSNGMSAL